MITIVDYGVGNVRSIANMLKKAGASALITDDIAAIEKSDKIILPGVGAFDTAMKELDRRGLRAVLQYKAMEEKVPLLGICLGMQLLTRGSEEGQEPGFGWIPGYAYRFPRSESLKVPHMRWNQAAVTQASALTQGLDGEARFYFVHSYYVRAEDQAHAIMRTEYGISFDAALQKENIMGVQFHPERSHKFGLKLLHNFTAI